VDEELKRPQSEGILSKVEWSDWATPIVPVPKQDGSVRICRHFEGTINPVSSASNRRYFSHSVGGKTFCKIDLRQAYHQIELEEEFKKYSTLQLIRPWACVNTIDWRTMDQILEGTPGISSILADMIVTKNLEEVLRLLHHHGLIKSQ
jgi:hypothetical protein